tara:strand:+ start:27 stop:338 length:312 start_codon:yes stop_codon:yes gene_type:complete
MVKQTNTFIDGTSFYGVKINTTPQQLIEALGEPEIFDNTGKDKCNMNYWCLTDTDIFFSIYDWKYYEPLNMSSEYSFHIGGFTKSECMEAVIKLEQLLQVIQA